MDHHLQHRRQWSRHPDLRLSDAAFSPVSAAATFALLNAAMALAIDYVMIIDAHGYDWRGITGAFLTEALVSGSACVLFTIILRRRLLTARPTEEPA